MVVTKTEFQDMVAQVNEILTKLDERVKALESKSKPTTQKAPSQEKT